MTSPTRPAIIDLLELHSWTVFDIDDAGRVLAGSDASGSTQLVEVGGDGQPTVLTELPGACSGRYLPGRRAVVVQHDTDGDERAQLSLLDLDRSVPTPARLEDLRPLVRDPRYIHALVDVRADAVVYRTNRRNGVDFDVVVRQVDLGGDQGDGDQVVYDDGGYVTDVHTDAETAAVTLLSTQPGSTQVRVAEAGLVRDVTAADDHAWHTSVHIDAASGGVLMASNHGRDVRAVVRVSADGAWSTVVESAEHDLAVLPAPDGSRLLVTRNVDGADQLALHEADGGWIADIDLPAEGVASPVWSPDAAWIAIGLSSPASPGDVLRYEVASGTVQRLVDGASAIPATIRKGLATSVSVRIPTRDGEQIPCFVYAPSQESGALRGSVVIMVHGGPESQARRQFSPVIQGLVAAGHIVLTPNVRGSTGYGKRWYSMDDVRLRLESVHDLVDIRSWVPAVGGDPDRVALYGGSYGGYMVLAGVSMHPGLWAAGVDIVGMSSLVTFLENTSAYRRAFREREYGSLEHDRDFLAEASPLTYLDAIRTPLFVIHGANDPRVPLSESEQIKKELDAKEVRCVLRVYDDEGHGLAKRVNRLDAYPAALEFLASALS